ncbi:MAG: HAMP domain-containing protein, partial [Geopsychrobacter sp.]|nr:HAMP domain-containing protein [Geopsychrobacter sp.]
MTRKNTVSSKRFGLRRELLVTQIVLFVSAWLLGGAIFLGIAEQAFIESRLKQGVFVTRFVAAQLASSSPLLDNTGGLYQSLKEADVIAWKIYGQDLTLVNSLETDSHTTVISQTISRLLQKGELKLENQWPGWWKVIFQQTTPTFTVAAPICSGNNCRGVVQVKFHFGDVVKRLKQILIWVCGYTLVYVIVLGVFALVVLNRNIVRPMQSLLKAIQLIGSGKLDTKLTESGPLEIYTLSQSFNSMTQALKSSRTETEQSINSLQQINKQLKQAQNELVQSEKLASVGTLAAGMAHEVGNPLGAIIGYLELLKDQLAEGPEKTIAQRATTEALRIDHLVKDLLDYAQPNPDPLMTCEPWAAVHNAVTLL